MNQLHKTCKNNNEKRSLLSFCFSLYKRIKQWAQAKLLLISRKDPVSKEIKTPKQPLRRPIRIVSRAKDREKAIPKAPIPQKKLTWEEIYKEAKVEPDNDHLYIIDTRYMGYAKDSLWKVIFEVYNHASKIIIIRGVIAPKSNESNLISRKRDALNIEVVKPPKKSSADKNIASVVTKNMELFSKITVIKSLDKRDIKVYKGKKKTSNGYPSKKKKQHKVKRTEIPSWEEIMEMRGMQSRKENLIVWDIENISYRNIDKVLQKAYKEGDISMVSVEPFSENMTKLLFPYILLYGIKIYTGHEDSDKKIVEIIEERHEGYGSVTIVSSDTDFVPIIKTLLAKDKLVNVVSDDSQKTGMLMRLKIDHKNLTINTIHNHY